jgi:hypothetical protein
LKKSLYFGFKKSLYFGLKKSLNFHPQKILYFLFQKNLYYHQKNHSFHLRKFFYFHRQKNHFFHLQIKIFSFAQKINFLLFLLAVGILYQDYFPFQLRSSSFQKILESRSHFLLNFRDPKILFSGLFAQLLKTPDPAPPHQKQVWLRNLFLIRIRSANFPSFISECQLFAVYHSFARCSDCSLLYYLYLA